MVRRTGSRIVGSWAKRSSRRGTTSEGGGGTWVDPPIQTRRIENSAGYDFMKCLEGRVIESQSGLRLRPDPVERLGVVCHLQMLSQAFAANRNAPLEDEARFL